MSKEDIFDQIEIVYDSTFDDYFEERRKPSKALDVLSQIHLSF